MSKVVKYGIRRALFSLVTLPLAFAGYGALYFGLGVLAATSTASVQGWAANLPSVAAVWVLGWVLIAPLVSRPSAA